MYVQLTKDFLGRKAGERLELAEADAAGLLASAAVAAEDALAPLVGRALDGISGSVQAAVDQALKQFAQAQTLSRKNVAPRVFGEGGGGDPKQTFGRFLLAVRHGDRKALDEM